MGIPKYFIAQKGGLGSARRRWIKSTASESSGGVRADPDGTGRSWAGLSAADSDDSDECEAVTGGSRTALSGGGSRRPAGKSRRQSVDLRRGSTFVLGGGGAWCGGSRRRYAGESRRQQVGLWQQRADPDHQWADLR
ncbi:hypothetical protein OsI_02010 [Oryza sativa Indica Group]|uniref:Uncharacterized protein n=1 Tax=Oryza sativa subsp. indica TaxID=39946 RepID=A2WQ82_ORYSI|nr:hypothetical protein OsI_02010 [Oryza sativa Indica Group]